MNLDLYLACEENNYFGHVRPTDQWVRGRKLAVTLHDLNLAST